MSKKSYLPILTLVTTFITIAFNSLANILPLNGLSTGEISDRFPVYFVPAGYVFSIWGVIYLALTAFSIYQVLPKQADNPWLQRIRPIYIIASLVNIIWLALWHYEQITFSLLAMLTLLVSLILIYMRLEIGRKQADWSTKLLLDLPFSLYLGWVSVATIANVTTVLFANNWGGWGISPTTWAVIMLVIGGILAGLVLFTRRDLVYALVFIWAFVGIAVKHAATQPVMLTSYLVAGLIVVFAAISLLFLRPQAAHAGQD